MSANSFQDRIATIRHFNRFYTRQIGVLRDSFLHSPYSLTEVRILYELANRENPTATELGRDLGLDAGYLSRTLARFEEQGLLERTRSEADGRQRLLRLTREGKKTFSVVNKRSNDEAAQVLDNLAEEDQLRLLKAMQTVETLLDHEKGFMFAEPFVLRLHEPGDMGWVVHRHGVLYAQEYGWNEQFEALVAQIVADFINHFKPERERCWIAEMNGEIVGSVFCVQKDEAVAKLRLLLVEPKARGMGLGKRLVQECIRFARRVGYKKLVLWTNSVLVEARHIYEKEGFKLVAQKPHHSFGQDLIEEDWELDL